MVFFLKSGNLNLRKQLESKKNYLKHKRKQLDLTILAIPVTYLWLIITNGKNLIIGIDKT